MSQPRAQLIPLHNREVLRKFQESEFRYQAPDFGLLIPDA
jgi:hypothetical protein